MSRSQEPPAGRPADGPRATGRASERPGSLCDDGTPVGWDHRVRCSFYAPLAAAVLLAAFAVRLTWALASSDPLEFPDSSQYLNIAHNLASGKGFAVDFSWQFAVPQEYWGRGYIAHYPPLYPAFLAALGAVGLTSPRAVACVQVVPATLTVWLAMALARRLFGEREALAAGTLAAFDPHLVFFTAHLLTETLFTSLLTGAVFFLARSGDEGRGAGLRAASWGALAGLAALTRVTHLLFMPLAAAADILIAGRSQRGVGRRTRFHAIAAGVFLLVLAPWTVRNAVRLGAFVPGTTQLGEALWDAFGPEADGTSRMPEVAWPQELRTMGELERDRYMRREAAREIARRPHRATLLALSKLARLWSPVSRAEGYTGALYWIVGGAAFLALVGGAIAGAALRRREWSSWWPAIAPAAYITGVTCVFAGSVRFRIPAEATLAVLAGAGYVSLWNGLRGGKGPCAEGAGVPSQAPEEPR